MEKVCCGGGRAAAKERRAVMRVVEKSMAGR